MSPGKFPVGHTEGRKAHEEDEHEDLRLFRRCQSIWMHSRRASVKEEGFVECFQTFIQEAGNGLRF